MNAAMPWMRSVVAFPLGLVAIQGGLATQPVWLKALVLAALPLQVWLGARLAQLTLAKKGMVAGS